MYRFVFNKTVTEMVFCMNWMFVPPTANLSYPGYIVPFLFLLSGLNL